MTARLERRYSSAAAWARSLGAFSVVLFLTSVLSHRFGLLETVPFLWLLGLCFLLALSGLCLAFTGLAQFWKHGVAGLGSAALAVLLSALVLVPYGVSAYRLGVYPLLVDISTDISRPPQLLLARQLRAPPMTPLRPMGQAARLLQIEAYPELIGRRYEYAGENVIEAVAGLLADRHWEILTPLPSGEVPRSFTMEAVARSYLLGFPSDVAIRIEERANATYVDMRSVSRYGLHDMGDNALRIERFLDDLDRRVESVGTL